MPTIERVICLSCGVVDEVNWGEFGAEQPCLECDAPAVHLVIDRD